MSDDRFPESIGLDEFMAFLKDVGADDADCPLCGNEAFTFLGFGEDLMAFTCIWHKSLNKTQPEKPRTLEEISEGLKDFRPYVTVPFVHAACKKCGYVRSFYAPIFDEWRRQRENG